jgi:hypothetical protein
MTTTDNELRALMARVLGEDDRYVLMKRGLYYRPGGHGYTESISEAWVLPEAEADKRVTKHIEEAPVTKLKAPLKDYPNDLNEMWKAEKTLRALAYLYQLGEVVCGDRNAMATSGKLAELIHATARQRCIAFLRTKGVGCE